MFRTPLLARSFPLPSGRITRPAATIRRFHCPDPPVLAALKQETAGQDRRCRATQVGVAGGELGVCLRGPGLDEAARVGGEHQDAVTPVAVAVPLAVAGRDEKVAGCWIDHYAGTRPDRSTTLRTRVGTLEAGLL